MATDLATTVAVLVISPESVQMVDSSKVAAAPAAVATASSVVRPVTSPVTAQSPARVLAAGNLKSSATGVAVSDTCPVNALQMLNKHINILSANSHKNYYLYSKCAEMYKLLCHSNGSLRALSFLISIYPINAHQ